MKKIYFLLIALALCHGDVAYAQNKPSTPPVPRPSQTPAPQAPARIFDITYYGVRIEPEPRLIVMMAALDAAGFDPTPPGSSPSFFRAQVRKDQAELDQELRKRLRDFYERNKLPAPATSADQAARYVSLAYVIGPAPVFDAPPRSEDLPASVLEVLDFAPLLREFYRRSGIEDRLPAYIRSYQAEGDRLRRPTAEMVRSVLSYLHTQPITMSLERVPIKNPAASNKKNQPQAYTTREHERRFLIVPDLLAAPGAINFRIIADDYYAVVPPGTDPSASELRRAYLQYVIDPLVLRYNKEIAARREPLRTLLTEVAKKTGNDLSPDIFLTLSRSLVAAAEVRLDETTRLDAVASEMRRKLDANKDEQTRASIIKEAQARRASISDEAVAQLADAYERGAVLAFYFADQLRGIESSGFDVANFFADMIASFDTVREGRRPAEYAEARARALAARQARQAERASANATAGTTEVTEAGNTRNATLVKGLFEVEEMLRLKDYTAAESRLKELMKEFPREPRIFFALGQTASLSARDAIDEAVQAERLNRALANFRDAVSASTEDTDRGLLSRAHEAMGRILAFLDRPAEALKEFDAAIRIGNVKGGAYTDALNGKKQLDQQK